MNFHKFNLDLEKPGEPENKLLMSTGLSKKQESFRKKIYFCFIDYAKAFAWITTNYGKFFQRWEYQTTWPASREICMQVKNQHVELDMEQTGFK